MRGFLLRTRKQPAQVKQKAATYQYCNETTEKGNTVSSCRDGMPAILEGIIDLAAAFVET